MTWRHLGFSKESALWRLDILTCSAAVGAAVAAVWATDALQTSWRIVAAIAGVALLGLGLYGYIHVRMMLAFVENALRGRGEHEHDVLISYKHAEHQRVAVEVHEALASNGLAVWLDKRGGSKPFHAGCCFRSSAACAARAPSYFSCPRTSGRAQRRRGGRGSRGDRWWPTYSRCRSSAS
jgi:hypothetical protein